RTFTLLPRKEWSRVTAFPGSPARRIAATRLGREAQTFPHFAFFQRQPYGVESTGSAERRPIERLGKTVTDDRWNLRKRISHLANRIKPGAIDPKCASVKENGDRLRGQILCCLRHVMNGFHGPPELLRHTPQGLKINAH